MRSLRIALSLVVLTLICVGIVMVYSASSIYSLDRYDDSMFFLKRQLVFVFIGFILTFLSMAIDYRRLKQVSKPLLLASLALLVLVLVPGLGRQVAGARRWFRFGPLSFQPSELASFAMLVYIADFLSRKKDELRNFWKGYLPPMLVMGSVALLILMQPDLGSALAISVAVLLILFIAGVNLKYLGLILLAAIPLVYVLIFSVPYRRARIMSFLNPWADPQGSGFQIIKSQIALGSGKFFGLGLGHSKQKLFYLPAAHTDFIYSIIGEELGLLGTLAIVTLFILFIVKGLKIVRLTEDRFGYFLGLGIVLLISLRAMVNMGVSIGILPTKGLPLPFISYGGSSLVMDMLAVGLLLNISRFGDYP
ncbi:MAG: putative lipid II flippase FtsW [Candidatus Omnitrophica bacterium]|nr:putative lipid II flippase FtsW [Candidatus Omnitrophota bacterium]